MIKYNNKTINDWYFDDKNIIKVYKNNAICYYRIVSGGVTPSQEPCFAVVENISSYQDREFVDVYDKATEKWYKLNNLNQYEQYGIYGEGRNITYYKGKLTIDEGYEYEWDGSQWVNLGEVEESTARLPDVPFTVNINAKNYNATTKTFAKANGQLADTDIVITAGTPVLHDGYVTVNTNTRGVITGYQTYFNRDNSNPTLTIISKQKTANSVDGHMFANRDSDYNWMYRAYGNKLTLHGNRETGSLAVTSQPVIESVRVSSERTVIYNNYTDNTTSSTSNFSYGNTNTGGVALFAGYAANDTEWFAGDFYWIYMSQTTLTDEQVQQVIDYNEGEATSVYPKYYTEKDEPENIVVFATMEEALAYECPWVGMFATIAGELYKFNANNEWEKLSFTITGVTRASEAFKIKLNNADADATIFQDNGDGTYNFGVVYLDPITDTTSMASGNTNLVKFDFGNADISNLTTIGQNTFRDNSNLTTFEIPDGITKITTYAFYNCNNYIDVKIPESLTVLEGECFYRQTATQNRRVYIIDLSKWCNINISGRNSNPLNNGNLYLNNSLVATLTLPSDITQFKQYLFTGCKSIQTLNIPDNITSLGNYDFYSCSNLSTINWGTGLTSIGQETFEQTGVISLNSLPNGITSIPYRCFAYCNNLQAVTIPDSVTSIDTGAFLENYALHTLTLSQNLTTIGNYAFQRDRSLKTLTIPSKITSIGYDAFQNCSGLTSITVEATTPPTLGTNVFNNTNDCPIYVPCASVNAYRTATNWSNYADRIVGFESCTTYDWQTISGEYVCEDGNKYEVEKYVRSFDNGTTWEDVTPLQTRKGALIAEGVPECVQKTYTDGTYTYNALQDVTVPMRSVNNNYNLYVPYDFEPNYKYSVEFTPLNFWTTSYYGFILGNGDTSVNNRETPEFHVLKMDNGWGTQFYRFGAALHNYSLGTRGGQGLPGAWTVYENVRAKIETHLVNYAAGNGATITVENEGYETYTGTSTKIYNSSWSATYGVKNICLFGTYTAANYSANMKFHNFAVKTSTDELVYNYVPVERQSDGKLGVYDTVHNIFYLANDNLGLVAGDYVYGE